VDSGDVAISPDQTGSTSPVSPTGPSVDVDVDLTGMSATLAQAEFQRIVINYDRYMGMTIKASGAYFNLYLYNSDSYHHFVTVVAGDECCRMAFEFILSGDSVFPDDYPAGDTRIEVIGVLNSYEERGRTYLYLSADEVTVIG